MGFRFARDRPCQAIFCLDLAINGGKPLGIDLAAQLAEVFAESDLPYKVDIVDWTTASEAFKKVIERDRVVVQAGRTA